MLAYVFLGESLVAVALHTWWLYQRLLVRRAARQGAIALTADQINIATLFVRVEFTRFAINVILVAVGVGILLDHPETLYAILFIPAASILASVLNLWSLGHSPHG